MGQRHQAFIIARVLTAHGEKHYRCVGAFHHQWCYETLPLSAAARFLTLIQQKDNAEIIREELRLIQGKYGRWRRSPEIPKVPLPYTTFLLASSWNMDYEDLLLPYVSGTCFSNDVQWADMGSTQGDNNEGITIFDITTPENPSYCFITNDGVMHIERRVPISAAGYVRSYDPSANEADEFIVALNEYPLVTLEVLTDAWPQEYQRSLKLNPTKSGSHANEEPANTVIPSLVELTLKSAVEEALRTDQTTAIEELVWMPQKAELIKAVLQEQNPFLDSGVALLTKIVGPEIEVDKTFDLSHFFLASEQIISMVSQFQNVEVLKLSHNTNVTIDTVRGVLSSLPRLRSLFLLDTSVAGEDLCNLLVDEPKLFFNIETLVHPHFLTLNEGTYPNAFSLVTTPTHMHSVAIASLPCFTPALVVQALVDYLSAFTEIQTSNIISILQSTLLPQVILASDVRRSGQSWAERNVPVFPLFSLRALKGEGWFFAFKWAGPLFPDWPDNCAFDNKYAFVKINAAALHQENQVQEAVQSRSTGDEEKPMTFQHKVCNLSQFLEEMALEGRPIPPAHLVDALATVFGKLGDEHGLALMNHDEVESFVKDTKFRIRFRY